MKKLIIATFELEDEAINLLKQLENQNINVKETSIVNKSEDTSVLGAVKVDPDEHNINSPQKKSKDPIDDNEPVIPAGGNTTTPYPYPYPYGIGVFSYSNNGAVTITGPLFYNISEEEEKDLSKYLEKRGIPSSDIKKFEQALLKNHTVFLVDSNEEEASIISTKFLSHGALDVETYDQ
jgi:hypothetical protein